MKYFVFTLVVLFSLVLSGCSGTNSSTGSSDTTYAKGTLGVSFFFMDNQPPSKIYLTEDPVPFPITVEVRNEGTYELGPQDLIFTLSGVDPTMITIPESEYLRETLDGKTQYLPEGGFTIKELGELALDRDNIGTEYNPTILLSAYYKYKTRGSVPICIDPDLYDSNSGDKVCTAQDVSISGGQGSPIAVVKVEQVSSPSKAIFKLYFSNAGSGTVFSTRQSLEEASRDGIGIRYKDLIHVTASLGGQPLDCRTDDNGNVRVDDVLYCTYNYDSSSVSSAFSTVINFEIEFNYKTSVQKSLTIINLKQE
ncbi:hypothetical protein JXM83_06645 [Candidatus Woesearchaeota archaeon]|nr:hypothetical protein [Candidatus Woesearchaeota archaeon]